MQDKLTIGEFTLLEKLGEGAYSKVYKAIPTNVDPAVTSEVALKV